MSMSRFNGKTVAIIGLSIEGVDTLAFFLTQQCKKIICADRRPAEELASVAHTYANTSIEFCLGDTYLDRIGEADIIIRTPGMSPRTPQLIAMAQQGKEVTSATNIFFECCPGTIIGVTGTKGKGTTSTLIEHMLIKGGKHVYLGGNVGVSLLVETSPNGARALGLAVGTPVWCLFKSSALRYLG